MMKEKLIELAKSKGLDLAEDSVERLVELIFEGLDIVVAETENKIDDVVFAALKETAKEAALKLVDKIDGSVNESK